MVGRHHPNRQGLTRGISLKYSGRLLGRNLPCHSKSPWFDWA